MDITVTKSVSIRIEGVEAHVGLTLTPIHDHVMESLRQVYDGESMNTIACYAVTHMHSRLAEQSVLPDGDVMLKSPDECWQSLQRFADCSNRELVKLCLLSLWAKHSW